VTRRWVPPLAWGAVVLVLTSIPVPQANVPPNSDKVVHLALYLPLGYLVARSLDGLTRRTTALMSAVLLVTAFAIVDEWHQRFIPGRSSDPRDAVADTAGGLVGVLGAAWRDRRVRPRSA